LELRYTINSRNNEQEHNYQNNNNNNNKVNKNNSNKKANNSNQTKISNLEQSLSAVIYYTNLNTLIFTQRAILTVHHQWCFKTLLISVKPNLHNRKDSSTVLLTDSRMLARLPAIPSQPASLWKNNN